MYIVGNTLRRDKAFEFSIQLKFWTMRLRVYIKLHAALS